MESGNDIKASLNIAMQTLDTKQLQATLQKATVEIYQIQDSAGYNVFHDLSCCIVRESKLIEYLSILEEEIQKRHPTDYKQVISSMLNKQTNTEKRSPLLLAVKHNRRVNSN